jgi:prepilin-type N-terminal cleavage/methylation domain-containing protein
VIKQKAFTLFEIIIVIILISIFYLLVINNFHKRDISEKQQITLLNLKENLLKFDYDKSIKIQCINDSFDCLLFIDGILQEQKIKSLFTQEPIVYKYNKDLDKIEFADLELESLDRYEIVFEYGCNINGKCNEYIVETPKQIFVYNDIFTKPIVLSYLSDIEQYFTNKIIEVKDAF